MKLSKILCLCVASALLFVFVAGCTNEPAKPTNPSKNTSGSNKT